MGDMPDIRDDLPMSMTMSAFIGISWYIGAEINTSLFLLFKRRRGLYFWACALCSWGVVLQPLFIILADFNVWTNLRGSITMIYLSWAIMVVPQSWVLYSRLHLIMHEEAALRWIKFALIFTSIVFSVPTIIIGLLAQATNINPNLLSVNTVWDRLQLIVFFVQETSLSILYIWKARTFLRDSSLLHKPPSASSVLSPREETPPGPGPSSISVSASTSSSARDTKEVLRHLIYTNVLIIALDSALLGIQCAGLFYLQGAFKPCVYGIKLKVEFVILNRLIKSIRTKRGDSAAESGGSGFYNSNGFSRGYDPSHASSGLQQFQSQQYLNQQHHQQKQRTSSNTSDITGFWARRSRRSQGGISVGGGGGGDEGGDVWLSQLDRPSGPRSRSHESQSPILRRTGSSGYLGVATPDSRTGASR